MAAVVGHGEAETAPLATSSPSNKFLSPIRDGAVLPIFHLNGYKIANPVMRVQMPTGELKNLFHGCGYSPEVVAVEPPAEMHELMAATLERRIGQICALQNEQHRHGHPQRPQ